MGAQISCHVYDATCPYHYRYIIDTGSDFWLCTRPPSCTQSGEGDLACSFSRACSVAYRQENRLLMCESIAVLQMPCQMELMLKRSSEFMISIFSSI